MSAWSAVPVYICCAERGWSVSEDAPASTSRGPSSSAAREPFCTPRRSFTVTGTLDRAGDRLDDAARAIGILEEVRAGARLRDLLHRAAEVDVDDVGSDGLDHARGVRHRSGVGAEELDRERVLVGGDAEVAERLLVAVLDPGAAHHLGAHEAGAVAASLAPKRLHADARHRARGRGAWAPRPGRSASFAKVDHGRRMVLRAV